VHVVACLSTIEREAKPSAGGVAALIMRGEPVTTEPKVLIEPSRKGSARSPLAPAPDFGWLLLGWIGLAFALIGGGDVLLTWVPMHFGSPEWEFGTITSSLDGMPVLTM